jgi:2-polyprenyl-3-methyl-5-hydroxy-6-metoxy-1,4-benzoquinol methylase
MAEESNYEWLPQACPVCEVSPAKRIGRRGGAAHRQNLGVECEVWRCGGCGLIFPNPMPVPLGGPNQHYGVQADEYFDHHDVVAKGRAAADFLRMAEQLTGGKGALLDIGSGRGEFLRAAREQGWSAVGIEPSASFREYAAKYAGAELKSQPVEECGFAANSFNVVILLGVLEHLYNPDETLREIARILRPGGALLLDVPNERGLYFLMGNLYQKLRGRNWVVNLAPTFSPFHVFGFTPRSLRALLRKHGFQATEWCVYGGTAMVPTRKGALGALEQIAARAVTTLSSVGSLGTYIQTWAIKSPDV